MATRASAPAEVSFIQEAGLALFLIAIAVTEVALTGIWSKYADAIKQIAWLIFVPAQLYMSFDLICGLLDDESELPLAA